MAQPAEGKKIALLVGINVYDHSNLADLKYCEHDVEELAAVFRNGGYEVTLMTGSHKGQLRGTEANIQSQLTALLKTARATIRSLSASRTWDAICRAKG